MLLNVLKLDLKNFLIIKIQYYDIQKKRGNLV